jgi:hypothetical protein
MPKPSTNKFSEEDFKGAVASWLFSSSGLQCLLTPEVPKSVSDPRPDVVGILHVGGQLSGDFEVVSVTIRPSIKRFISACGEAKAHSIQADRSYLACYLPDGDFAEDQIAAALHLGIGLLRLDGENSCQRVVPAPPNNPQSRSRVTLLHQLGLVICQLCGVTLSLFPEKEDTDAVLWNEQWADRFGRLRNESVYDRRHLCSDCVRNIRELRDEHRS